VANGQARIQIHGSVNRSAAPQSIGEECVPNIGLRGRRRRRRNGVSWLLLSLALALVVVRGGLPEWFLAVVWVTAFMAGLGFFQAKEKT